ncbi:DUF2797 domain-containing protein [Streptomyces sp. NPDC056661]|uniref:DUF2797 domain-containing protein n=1 Tax=Streptomyces sp. NPDC056661 TaxID=3345898 RepID=UPI0036A11EF7
MSWHCTGLRWPQEGPVLGWRKGGATDRAKREAGSTRVSVLEYGKELGFRAGGERHCVGARGNACPLGATVSGRSTGARCPECARLDRAHSVAADTIADDPRTYRVYLAWFGPSMVKVGITAEERGAARLREQGAVVYSWLGRGPLMAARRTEELLRSALGVPDRIPYARKRAVRAALPGAAERVAEVEGLYGRAAALEREGAGWPQSLERLPFEPVDHTGLFGLDGPVEVARVVTGLMDGGVVAGRLVAAAGPDLHLAAADGVVVLDTRLMTGWELAGADARSGVTAPVIDIGGGGVQDGLF